MSKFTGGRINDIQAGSTPTPEDSVNDIMGKALEKLSAEASQEVAITPEETTLSSVPVFEGNPSLGLREGGGVDPIEHRLAMAEAGQLNPQMGTQAPTPVQMTMPAEDSSSNMLNRADKMAINFTSREGEDPISVNMHFAGEPQKQLLESFSDPEQGTTAKDVQRGLFEAEDRPNTLPSVFHHKLKVNTYGIDGKYRMDPDFPKLMSIVTENSVDDAFMGAPESSDFEESMDEHGEVRLEAKVVNPSDLTERLGRNVETWWNRQREDPDGTNPTEPLTSVEARDLGAAAIQSYYVANPDMFDLVKDKETGGDRYVLTDAGAHELSASRPARSAAFNVRVPPLHTRPEDGLPGELSKEKPRYKSKKGMGGAVGLKEIDESINNQNRVAHVVDRDRMRILLLTSLEAVSRSVENPNATWGNNYGVGRKNFDALVEKGKRIDGLEETEAEYSALNILGSKKRDLFKELMTLSSNMGVSNYLTYNAQPLTGRMAAQQTDFNPTRNKSVRFATRSKDPAVVNGRYGRIYDNMIQIYSLNLLDDDLLLSGPRRKAFEVQKNKFLKWGEELDKYLKEALPDDNLMEPLLAIKEGIPIDHPSFPMPDFRGFASKLSPELKKFIQEKGEDGNAAIDSLVDLYKMEKALDEGKQYYSYANAYIDGKTNGIANQALMLGNYKLSYMVGALRDPNSLHALQTKDDGTAGPDVRAEMKRIIINNVTVNGVQGIKRTPAVIDNDQKLRKVLIDIGSFKPINKAISMIFPYGKEINGMKAEIEALIPELISEYPEVKVDMDALEASGVTYDEIMTAAHANVVETLFEIFGADTFRARAMMRNSGFLMASMDKILSIKSAMGHNINLGGMKKDSSKAVETSVSVGTQGVKSKLKLSTSPTYMSSAAVKKEEMGGYSRGRSAVIPVQSMDAATVVKTSSGKSWEKLKQVAPNGDPYFLQIFDAYKVDANTFDVMYDEINQNWLDITTRDWNYFEETRKSVQKGFESIKRELSNMDQNEDLPITLGSRFDYIGAVLNPDEGLDARGDKVYKHATLRGFVQSTIPMSKSLQGEAYDKAVAQKSQYMLDKIGEGFGIYLGRYNKTPPAQKIESLKPAQVLRIIDFMYRISDYDKNSSSFVAKIESQRKDVRAKIMDVKAKTGVGAAQFHAH